MPLEEDELAPNGDRDGAQCPVTDRVQGPLAVMGWARNCWDSSHRPRSALARRMPATETSCRLPPSRYEGSATSLLAKGIASFQFWDVLDLLSLVPCARTRRSCASLNHRAARITIAEIPIERQSDRDLHFLWGNPLQAAEPWYHWTAQREPRTSSSRRRPQAPSGRLHAS